MEIVAKVSKGSKMDQIYLPKNRAGFAIGNYVIIKPLEEKRDVEKERLYFYGVKSIEPIKLEIIREVIDIIDKNIENYDNVIVTGSFLDKGFQFNDIDIVLATDEKIKISSIKDDILRKTGIKAHILDLNSKNLANGLKTDPLYQMMLSRCIAKKRFVYKIKHKINYKLLDLHLLKSKTLIDNFDILSGSEKYDLTRNMMAIHLYLQGKRVSKGLIDKEIKAKFGASIKEIKHNLIDKKSFLKKYTLIYNKTFTRILKGIESGAK